MTSTNTKLLLASTALVSAIAVAGVASAADTTIAAGGIGGDEAAQFTISTDANSDGNIDAGDIVTTNAAIADLGAGNSIVVSTVGATTSVSHSITGNAAAAAPLFDLTGTGNTINVLAGVTLTQAQAAATADGILLTGANNIVNVAGTIVTNGAANSIESAADVTSTVNILGTGVVGTINLDAATTATNVQTITVASGGTTGNISANGGAAVNATISGGTTGTLTTGAGNDALVINGATATTMGAINLSTGTNTITINSTGTAANALTSLVNNGTDTLTVNSGTTRFSGNVDVNTLLVSGGTLNVSGTLGAGNLDDLTVASGAILSVTGATGVDASATIAGTMNQTAAAAIGGNLYVTGKYTGAANLAVTGNTVVSGTLTEAGTFGSNDLTVNNGGTVTVDGAVTIGDELIINSGGIVNIKAASTVATSLTVVSGGTLNVAGGVLSGIANFDVASGANVVIAKDGRINSTNGLANVKNATIEIDGAAGGALTSFGQLNITTGSVDFTTNQVGIKIAQGVDLATLDADTFASIVLGGAAAVSPTAGITGGNAILKYTWTANGNNYDLRTDLRTAGVTTLAGAATGTNNKGIAAVVDTAALSDLYSNVLLASDTDNALESLTPDVSGGAAAASINTSVASTGTISNRLALLRGTDNGRSGMVAGDEMMANRQMWIQAFGTDVDQDNRDGIAGFQATTGGLAIGADTDELVDGVRVGVAFSYAAADVESDSVNNAQTDIDTYQLSAYASHEMSNGVYVDGMISYAWNDHEGQRTDFLNNTYESEFDGDQFSLKGEVGKSYDWANTRVTPNFGLHYINVEADNYTETGLGGNALSVNNDDVSAFLISLGTDVEWNITDRSGNEFMPYVRAKYSFDAMSEEVQTTSSFLAGGTAFTSKGADIEEHSITLGTGVNVIATSGFEFTAAYDAEIKEDFLAHTGVLQARWSF